MSMISDFKYPTKYPKPHFVIRKVINGKVKIRNRYFTPQNVHVIYDGRFEGMKFLFGLYWVKNNDGMFDILDFIYLWGTEKENSDLKNSLNLDDDSWADDNAPYIVKEDGKSLLPWCFWYKCEG